LQKWLKFGWRRISGSYVLTTRPPHKFLTAFDERLGLVFAFFSGFKPK
jgi:hypothetical protein